MTTLAHDLVPDELWALVEPLLPAPPRPPYGGRHRAIPDRNCFAAIVFMARTSTPWRLLPAQELGCGSPATCWRRLTEWAAAGVFDALHLAVLDRLGEQGQVDWSRASVDTMSVVERSLSWLGCFRRLQVRWDRDSGRWFRVHPAGCAVVCCNRLYQPAEVGKETSGRRSRVSIRRPDHSRA